ncbi:MAG: amino acid racemase [Spirochaetaceae bacterium]|jgi:aspartate racemase|nr:amino acid racemase [Spirochaetaceae bacterium]
MKETCIGVIGGVGPYAGLDFLRNIFANTRAVKDQDHLNCMLISCPSIIPDRTNFLLQEEKIDEKENPAFGMFACAKSLYAAGATYAAVACNTAHASKIFSRFLAMTAEALPEMQIVNMLETCADYVKTSLRCSRLGLLATAGTHKSKVYHEYFSAEKGFDLIEPEQEAQKKIHTAIYSEVFGIKAQSQPVTPQAQTAVAAEIYALAHKGAQAVILGCTELPLAVASAPAFPIPLIDPAILTARKLIALTAPEKLAPL